jgi:hypothetical protein
MAQQVNIAREVYGTTTYRRVVDTEFKQLVPPSTPIEEDITIEQFFQAYEELFFEIPVTGEVNSHEYLAKRSSEYVGGDVLTDNEKALIDEINSLRQQLLEANKSIVDISALS